MDPKHFKWALKDWYCFKQATAPSNNSSDLCSLYNSFPSLIYSILDFLVYISGMIKSHNKFTINQVSIIRRISLQRDNILKKQWLVYQCIWSSISELPGVLSVSPILLLPTISVLPPYSITWHSGHKVTILIRLHYSTIILLLLTKSTSSHILYIISQRSVG